MTDASSLDIKAALDATAAPPSKCQIQRYLDEIPEDAAHRTELVRLLETPHRRNDQNPVTRSARSLAEALTLMGFPTSSNTVLDHQHKRCGCRR